MKPDNLRDSKFSQFIYQSGTAVRLSFLVLLISFLLFSLYNSIVPEGAAFISITELMKTVIVFGFIAALFPRQESENEAQDYDSRPFTTIEFALAVLLGVGTGLALTFSIPEIRFSNIISALTALLSILLTVGYFRRT